MTDYFMRMNGGPQPGNRVVSGELLPWPPPDYIAIPGGRYVKTNQSAITDEAAATLTHVLRGAEYDWQADDTAVPA